jgi:hypothetical protein
MPAAEAGAGAAIPEAGAGGSAFPQAGQNFAPGEFVAPQREQVMIRVASVTDNRTGGTG